jgi:hypothetical protein
VLSFYEAYTSGDFTSVPNGVASAGYFAPAPEPAEPKGPKQDGDNAGGGGSAVTGGGGGTTEPTDDPTDEPTVPVGGGGGGGGNDGGGGDVDVPDLPDTGVDPVDDTITKAEATVECLAQVGADSVTSLNPLQLLDFTACMDELGF